MAKVNWKKITVILVVLLMCITYQFVLGVQKNIPTGVGLENLYVNDTELKFHNNRAIIGIDLNRGAGMFNEDYLVVKAISPLKVDINSNMKDCTEEYKTFEYRMNQKMKEEETNFKTQYRIYCMKSSKKPVVGLHHSGKEEFYGSIQFEVYSSNNGKLTPATRKIFEKDMDYS